MSEQPQVVGRVGRPEGVVLDGDVLRARRAELGLSQGNVADLAKLGVRTVRTAELGQPVSPDTARLIAQTLGLAYVEIIRPPPEMVRSRLLSAGLAALPPPDAWVPLEAERRLAAALQTEASVAVCVEGPSGVGKSTLVRRVLASLDDRWPDGVLWVAAGRLDTPERLSRLRADLADCLGFAARLPDPALVAPEAFEVAFRRHLWRWKRLLVLDDLEDPDLLRAFADRELGSHVVVTTHSRWVADHLDAERITLEPWPEDRVRRLLGTSVEEARLAADPEGAEALLDLVAGLPLHAHLAATSLRRTRHQTLGDYAARVKSALEGARPEAEANAREPLVVHLLDRLGGSLPQGALAALRDLAVFGDQPFAEPWAVAAVGRPPAETRMLLDALADAWLVRSVGDGPAARLRLDERALAAWGQGSPSAALRRLLAEGPALLDRLLGDQRHIAASATLQEHLPALRRVMDQATLQALGSLAPARRPADVPTPREPIGDALGRMLVRATGLMRLDPPREGGAWITAALAEAREGGGDDGSLAWLLAWWWFIRGDDLAAAAEWGRVAARTAREYGTTDRAVSMALHAGLIERAQGGMAAAAPLYAQALELARRPGCAPRLLLGAQVTQAAALVFADRANPRWREALALLEEAAPTGDLPEGDVGVLQGAALANLAVVRAVLGEPPVDPARVTDGLLRVMGILNDSNGSTALAASTLVERLGGTWPRPRPRPAEVLASGERYDAEAFLTHLQDIAAQLGAPSANRVADGLPDSPLGHLFSWNVTGFPLGSSPGTALELFLPLEPMREVLAGEGRAAALRFVAAMRGREHPLYRAIQELLPPG